jgi:spermidine synthase
MAGLALGSYFFGRIIDGHKDKIRFFSYLEIAIGAYGIAMIAIFKIIPYFYLFLYDLFSWNQHIFVLSLFMLAFISLIIPTTLMGGTFPVISKIYNTEIKRIGNDIGIVYGADTLGAGIGIIVGGFVLLPLWGLSKTAIIAALMNIFLGIFILNQLAGKEGEKYVKS